jgi:hypothetical protein
MADKWGLISSVSPTTGPIALYYEAAPDRVFAPMPSDIARKAVEFFVVSQRNYSATLLLQKLGTLTEAHGIQFLMNRPPGEPVHVQTVAFSTGERLA